MSSKRVNDQIDIVIPWVNGNDPEWLTQREQVLGENVTPNKTFRFRDWQLMRYWFRGIEQFAPWVNRIFFVTWGHLPEWLNTNHQKLTVIKHSEYMPEGSLPTYNSNALLINVHRIKELSEKFILFNDDTFLIKDSHPDDFFKKGKPRTRAIHCPYRLEPEDTFFAPLNDIAVINTHFSMRKAIFSNFFKWFNPNNGINCLSTLLMLPFPAFYGFINEHLPAAYLKSTFSEAWSKASDTLNKTTFNKLRAPQDLNEWLMNYWQLAKGDFYPLKHNYGKAFFPARYENVSLFTKSICEYISSQQGLTICINDGNISEQEFKVAKEEIAKAFDSLLPRKSQFEQ